MLVECKIREALTSLVGRQRSDEALFIQVEGNNLTSENDNKVPFQFHIK
jgi:hypothetical protein